MKASFKNTQRIAMIAAALSLSTPLAFAHNHGGAAAEGSAAKSTDYAKPTLNIVETAVGAGQFNTLASLLTSAGLVDALQAEGPYTVFAPTDEAFKKVPAATLAELQANPDALKRVLLYHVVKGDVRAEKVVTMETAETLQGGSVNISTRYDNVMIEGAKVTKADIKATNGVIHVIDTVLIPTDIVDIASGNDSFKTLTSLVVSAGLADTLRSAGPFTVFAPTDAAFAKVPQATLDALAADPDLLRSVLTYHVVPGRVTAENVVKLDSAKTVQGENVTIEANGEGVEINNAKVVTADIKASNGIIHVIDTVILPPSLGS